MFKRSDKAIRPESDSSSGEDDRQESTLVLASRGIGNRFRHLHTDLLHLIPRSKKEQKVDTRKDLRLLQELAELSSCEYIVLLETRNGQDYLWVSKRSYGPTFRLAVASFSTCDELGLLGNFYRNTRFIVNSSLHPSAENESLMHLLTGIFADGLHDCSSDKLLSVYEQSGTVVLRAFHASAEDAIETGPRIGFDIDLIMKGCFSGEIIFKKSSFTDTQ